jgi:transcriptional regulator with XRE-family HTH domain
MRDLNDKEELKKSRAWIARNVRELRKERRWTQAELAKRLDLSQARLSEIEGGDGSFTAEQFSSS